MGQVLVGEQIQQIPEIVPAVEGEPLDRFHEYQSGRQHHLGEVHRIDALLLMLIEEDARVLQQVDAVLGVHVLGQVELEVELPRGDAARVRGQGPFVVQERQAQLDDLQQVDVAPETDIAHYEIKVLYLK